MKRTRLSEGIYAHQYGLTAVVKVGKIQREKCFPTGTNLELLRSWRIGKRAELDSERSDQIAAVAGTLERDAGKFLKHKEGTAYYKAARSHLKAWYARFGTRLRNSITRDEVERQIAIWHEAKVSPRTIRHRCFLLRELYHTLDGPRARTPIDHIRLPKIPAPHPVAVPLKTVQRVAANLLKAGLHVDYARFLVRATTGQRPAQIMRATPDDLDLKRKIWFVRPAKGGLAVPLPLNADMVTAWKLFAKADAWGAFDTGVAAERLRRYGWPKDVRPYALRHTFAISLLLNGVGLDDVQGLLGHGQIQTTRLYYAPILVSRLKAATSRLPAVYQPKSPSRKRRTA